MSSRAAALLAADRAARRAAQGELARPLVLEAGAGTGKTATLIARLLAWALGPGWARAGEELAEAGRAPSEAATAGRVLAGMAAITFTEAAAAEMAERFARGLAALARGEAVRGFDAEATGLPAEVLGRRAVGLLGELGRFQVSTIHAFCAGLLRRHPLEAGVHPAFQVDGEGEGTAALLREVIDRELVAAYRDGADAPALALAAAGIGPAEVATAAARLVECGLPASELAREAFPASEIPTLLEPGPATARAFLDQGGRRLAAAGSRATVTLDTLRELEDLAAWPEEPGWPPRTLPELDRRCIRLREAFESRLLPRVKDWGRGAFNQGEAKALAEAAGAVAPLAAELARWLERMSRLSPWLLEQARRALAPLLAEVEKKRQERGLLSYQDLLERARRLLLGAPEVAERERRAWRQLLVDEFQDTDTVQCDLLRCLALSGPEEQRPALFLVGDPKQSIYGWRSADLAAYEGFVREVEAAGGRRERLSMNFRSLPAVLEEVERLVAPVMVAEEGVQPGFEPLVANPEGERVAAGERGQVEHWVSWRPRNEPPSEPKGGPETPSRAASELEAGALVRDLLAWQEVERARPEGERRPWAAAAVLLRSTGDLDLVLRAFEQAGIPYEVARDRSYFRRREVVDAAALVRAVLDPADHLALLTVLRAPWVGVPDAALPRLWQGGLPRLATELQGPDAARLEAARALAQRVAAELAGLEAEIPGLAALGGWPEGLLSFLELLGELRLSFAEEPADRFLERLRAGSLIEATEAARYLGPLRRRNLERFFRRLAVRLDQGGDVNEILRFLRTAVADSRDDPGGAPGEDGEARDGVQVLTIHKAKGLEFERVYLLQTHKEARGAVGAEPAAAERLGGAWHYQLFSWPSLGWAAVEERRGRVAGAELARLLYVATTRAKGRLVVAGCWGKRGRGGGLEKAPLSALLARRQPPGPDLAEAFERLGPGGEVAGEDGVLWRFLATEPAPVAAPARAAEGAPLEQIEAALARLAARRERARERMARPLRGAVSEEAHRRLERDLEERPEPAGSRALALAVGTAVHRFFEELPLGEAELRAEPGLAAAERSLALRLAGEELEAARRATRELLAAVIAGPLWQRLEELAPAVLARELPVLLPPSGEEGPVGFSAGAIDLLCRDPASGELLVVDFKSDELRSEPELQARAEVYGHQLRPYGQALAEALGLPRPPRLELWFLAAGRVVSV
ncbi:MAG: UvrD-helicase domain-containing protein [Thermoanaerobaculia bacterium]